MERVVECRDVSRTYDDDAVPVHALRDVDFDLAAGEWVSLAGPSGSGKSTLLHVIGGLDQPTAGSVVVDGVEVTALSAAQLSDLRLNKIGFVFQAYNLIPVLSAIENVEFILQLQGVDRAERRSRSRDALQSLGLADLEHRRPRRNVRGPAAARGHRPGDRHRARAPLGRRTEREPRYLHHPGTARLA